MPLGPQNQGQPTSTILKKPLIHLEEEPSIVVREAGPARHLAPQNDQLMSERSILSLKPALRLEWRGQDGPPLSIRVTSMSKPGPSTR